MLATAVSTAAFVLAFVGLALVVLALAFVSSRSAKKGAQPSRGARRAGLVAMGVVTVAFGIGLPLLGILVNSDSQAKQAPGGVELTAAQQEGREIFARNCASCHSLKASNAVALTGPNLDQLRPPKELTLNAIQAGRARGMGQMPALLVTGEDAEHVADYIAAVAGR